MKHYPGKILLFGEYSMIFDAKALLVPIHRFSAHWEKDASLSFSRRELSAFLAYLKEDERYAQTINLAAFENDLNQGWAIASNLPMGYGLGSSGTVVAAVYDRYHTTDTPDLLRLKTLFSGMEGFFHGKSSGIDPLQSLLGKPFRISQDALELLEKDFLNQGISVFLIDTKTDRKTRPLVEYFSTMREDLPWRRAFEEEYLPCVNACMDTIISGDTEPFFEELRRLSQAQRKFFRPMIPEPFLPFFEPAFPFHFGVKILGAGGGGYLLGFTDDRKKASQLLADCEVIWLREECSSLKKD